MGNRPAEEHSRTAPSDLAARLALPTSVVPTVALTSGGEVALWKARDRRRGAEVVLKVVPAARRDRLEAEARALARLGGHPGIVTVSAVGTAPDGRCWVITDLAAGGTLDERRGACQQEVLRWASELADAVAHAHHHGVVHGDITPRNVFLDAGGHVRLGDFGASGFDGDAASMLPGGHTPRFAAPERRRHEPASAASDVFGLGATVLFLLPDGLPGLPPRTRRVLLRCLRRAPGRRPSAARVARMLQM